MPRKALNILLWGVQVILALLFANAGFAKVRGMAEMIELFDLVGVGQWSRYFTGGLEMIGAVLILIPRTAQIGATVLATVMIGAVVAHIAILYVPITTPAILLGMAGFVVWGRRRAVT